MNKREVERVMENIARDMSKASKEPLAIPSPIIIDKEIFLKYKIDLKSLIDYFLQELLSLVCRRELHDFCCDVHSELFSSLHDCNHNICALYDDSYIILNTEEVYDTVDNNSFLLLILQKLEDILSDSITHTEFDDMLFKKNCYFSIKHGTEWSECTCKYKTLIDILIHVRSKIKIRRIK